MDHQVRKVGKRKEQYPSIFNPFSGDFFSDFFEEDLPASNVSETKKAFNLELSVPGFDKGDFRVEVDKNILTISATRIDKVEDQNEDERVWRREFSASSFSRSFVLPENIDTEKITAKEKSGILKISLPKMEHAPEDKVKRIEIK